MSARLFIIVFTLLKLLYYVFTCIVMDKQRKKPLPKEVSDIYDQERYETYLNYIKDNRKLSIVIKIVSFVILILLTYSNMYEKIDAIAKGNVYLIYFMTYAIYFVVETIESYLFQYYDTFYVEAKYGFNKKDKKEFHKDFFLGIFTEMLLMPLLSVIVIFIGEHLPIWTNGFTMDVKIVTLICLGIFLIFAIFILFANFVSLWMLKKQYTFTLLEEGELKDKINALQEGAKKKVKKIYVYNESKKSTSKNAFLLRFLWIREFGIADNFISENAEKELLAVLSHEIGHLKHKKNIFDILTYGFGISIFALLVYALCNIEVVDALLSWICTSFDVNSNNYYMNIQIITYMIAPFMFLFDVYHNAIIRSQEYEADKEAVTNGYGEALIATFKKMSSDELINVNPASIIEFLEYDHPGMYHRIKAIMEANQKKDNR